MGQLDFLILPLVVIVIIQGYTLANICKRLDNLQERLNKIIEDFKTNE